MKRVFALAVAAVIGHASLVLAGDTILNSGARHAQALAVAGSAVSASTTSATSLPIAAATKGQSPVAAFQAQGATLSKSGMGKGKKAVLYLGLAAGFAASVWTIDHHVLNVTPSSLGTRQD